MSPKFSLELKLEGEVICSREFELKPGTVTSLLPDGLLANAMTLELFRQIKEMNPPPGPLRTWLIQEEERIAKAPSKKSTGDDIVILED